jgi:hypothetical protein
MRNDVCTSQEPSEWNPIATRWFHYGAAFFSHHLTNFATNHFKHSAFILMQNVSWLM